MRILLLALLLVMGTAIKAQQDSVLYLEINFELDSYALSTSEKQKVDSVLNLAPISVLKSVKIYGHTDSLADEDYNRRLSKNRVLSTIQYLVYNGIEPLKVQTDYYGEERPKYDNGPDSREKNRRVELELIIDPALLPPPEQKLIDLTFKKGDKIRIPNLNFVGNQPIPISQSFGVLEELLEVMYANPDLKIQLQGHVCCGDDYDLSMYRAATVYSFLRGNGIDTERMSYEGFSNTKPLFKERTEREKALNRRVEVLVESNTDRKQALPDVEANIDIEARVLGIKFFPQKGTLLPSGDFMLELIADMLLKSEGLMYEFVVIDNIQNKRVTGMRVLSIQRKLISKGVDKNIIKVRSITKPARMPISENDNHIFVRITKKY